MHKSHINLITRREFLSRSSKAGLAAALASLVDIPFVMKRALAEGSIGLNGKKVLFIFLRGANDSLNCVIPAGDAQYPSSRPTLAVPLGTGWVASTGGAEWFESGAGATFGNTNAAAGALQPALGLGNGFAALHPSLKFLAPVYNAGELALIHRVAYPKQSRSHFDSQRYWENGTPNNNLVNDGIFYRAILESGLAHTAPITGVSVQSSLPLILRGSEAAMTNLTDPTRYNLLGLPSPAGDAKFDAGLAAANASPFPSKFNRELLALQYQNLQQTLNEFAQMNFSEVANTYQDDIKTDGDTAWVPPSGSGGDSARGYFLFPTSNDKNGGWRRSSTVTNANKYVAGTNHYSFFNNLKAAAMILNNTDAIIAGTQLDGFDTHNAQGQVTGTHPNLVRTIGWAMYALRKYFQNYGKGGSNAAPGAKASWNDVVVVTLSEFGRTTVENGDQGTDHAEAGVMFVAGGPVQGYGRHASGHGVLNCHPSELAAAPSTFLNWYDQNSKSAMFGTANGYLRRNTDYRSVLGEILRKHLGATQGQLERIIQGYADQRERLLSGGLSEIDSTTSNQIYIRGEVGIL